jgi:acyl-CoA synthetase (AMP-forming)/AMP-acid ligase II
MIIGDIIERNAHYFPDKLALVYEGRRFTHRQFAERACRLANALIGLGLQIQERIAILTQNCHQELEAFGAAELAGFIAVPVNYRLAYREIEAVLEDCQPSVLIFEEQYREQARKLVAALPALRIVIAVDGPSGDALVYEELLANAAPHRPERRAEPEDVVYLIYTSGTTGRPKGVMLSHRALVASVQNIASEGDSRPTDRMLIVMPLYHIGGKIEQLTWSIRGATVFLYRAFHPEAILRAIETERITTAHLAPVMVQRLLDVADLERYDLASLRLVHYASAPMSVALLRRAIARFGTIFAQVYGMTEAMICTLLLPHQHLPDGTDAEARRLASAGQPFPNATLRVVRDDGTDCDVEEIGEILVGGPTVMSGYWNNTALTVEVMRQGWFDSGDRGFFDSEGFLFVADRKKDMIVTGGENVYSREVEEALLTHQAVAEAAVIAVPDREWGEAVKACVVLKPGLSADPAELIEHCRTRLAGYKKPRSIDLMAELPRMHNGKIDKKALRAPYWAGRTRQVS